MTSLKYESYNWNLKRLAFEFKYVFLMEMNRQFSAARRSGILKEEYFTEENWFRVNQIVDDMDGYFNEYCKNDLGKYESVREMAFQLKKLEKKVQDLENSTSLKVGRAVTAVPRKMKKIIK